MYWMTHDLRLDDNPALRLAAQSSELAVVTVVNPDWFIQGRYGLAPMGERRWQFLQQALADLIDSLARRGHVLHLFRGDPVTVLAELIEQGQFQRVVTSRQFGSDEAAQIAVLDRRFPDVTFSAIDTYTLFNLSGLPMPVSDIPETYSRFRRKAEKMTVEEPRGMPARLPAAVELDRACLVLGAQDTDSGRSQRLVGGEAAARAHAESYFSDELPLSYKLVRNELDGWENSSKFSAWLNTGCLSVRRLVDLLSEYEQRWERNDSTYWLYIELLWREYFQWLAAETGCNGDRRQLFEGAYAAMGKHEDALSEQLLAGLVAIPGLTMKGASTLAHRVATFSFTHDRHPASAIARQLSDAGLYCHWGDNYAFEVAKALDLDPQEGVLRLGIGHYNTADEVAEALTLIEGVLAA